MIDKLKEIVEDKPNFDLSGNDIGIIRTVRKPNTQELMNKINEMIEVINKISQ